MTRRTGSADLPLHGGRVPHWLGARMARLGAVITEAIVHEYGRDDFLRRLAHPFWFQSFGAVMGMDWHSSGITTSVIGALKRGLDPIEQELGIHVCGGRGRHSRQTPHELTTIGQRVGFDGVLLGWRHRVRLHRMIAALRQTSGKIADAPAISYTASDTSASIAARPVSSCGWLTPAIR